MIIMMMMMMMMTKTTKRKRFVCFLLRFQKKMSLKSIQFVAGCRTTAATASICFADIYLFICLFIQTLLRMHIISMSVIGMTVTTAPTPTPTPFTNTLCVGTIFILLNNRNNKYRKKRQRQRQRQRRRRRRRKYSSISCLKCVFDVTMMFG